jgi:cysteine desulfurase / selenocysteine lyase
MSIATLTPPAHGGAAPGGPRAGRVTSGMPGTPRLDVRAIRKHFAFPAAGRVVTNNAASTQPPRELLELYRSLAPSYENVHRGQSRASVAMTAQFEESFDTIARFIGAPGPATIALYRNTTEAINAVMYAMLTEFRDGDNVVTTLLEHNSNYVPWYALCREILPRLGRRVSYRLARFDPVTGELDLGHLASLIDARTKLVCCTGASNFLGTKAPLPAVRALADASGYQQPSGERRSYLLVDAAQLVPGAAVDVQDLDVDYLAFSFHKMLAPFGIGVLYGRQHLLQAGLPFLYGGDMIAEGRVFPDRVEYNALPWKYAAGTPNILGAIVSAQAARALLDLALSPKRPVYFGTRVRVTDRVVRAAMNRVTAWNSMLISRALAGLGDIGGLTIYGPRDAARRTSLVAFNLADRSPFEVAEALSCAGIETRAGCHCATLAHHTLGLTPPASCRLSFYLYNTPDEVDRAVAAVAAIAAGRRPC